MFTMKLIVLIFTLTLGSSSHAESLKSRRGTFVPPPSVFDTEELNKSLFSDNRNQHEDLKKIKYYLINGEIRLAKIYLNKLTYTDTKFKPIALRYLAMLHFIEGDFEKVRVALARPELSTIPHYSKICGMKVLTDIILSKTLNLEDDWGRCKVENSITFKEGNLVWLETLIQMKLNPNHGITRVPFRRMKLMSLSVDDVKMLLKLSLYLNQESLVEGQLNDLTQEQIQDPEIRELVGQIYFRMGIFSKSYKFVEELKSPNSENIKGNLYVLRDKYELAYAQFKLALEQKQNSQNAMERLLPLAWLLGDWENGVKYSERVIASPQTQINKLTVLASFLLQQGNYSRSREILNQIVSRSGRWAETDVTQLYSFVSLMENKPQDVIKQAKMSCQNFDLTNCWVLYQMQQWESFPNTMLRGDVVPSQNEWEKLTKEDIVSPINETLFVNQLDIEEMDDKLIQLTKAP